MQRGKGRFLVFKIIIVLMFAVLIAKLFTMQIVQGGQYKVVAQNRLTTNIVEKAPRGEIFDRYGTPLVTNEVGYGVMIRKANMSDKDLNDVFEKITDLLKSSGCEYYDTFPVSGNEGAYTYSFKDENGSGDADDEKSTWFTKNKYNGKYLNSTMTADALMATFEKIYKIAPTYTAEQKRRIIGARYEAELHDFSASQPFTIADGVSVEIVSKIKEKQDYYKNVSVTNDYVRKYEEPGLATQLLGRTGKISAEEYKEKSDEGYGMNDIIGKQGIEKYAEKYLKGTDGTTGTTKSVGEKQINVVKDVAPVAGDYLTLTIDAGLQKTVEDSLKKNIRAIQASGTKNKGADCNAGSAVVIDVKTGDMLAGASYPTYDMSKFSEEYSQLLKDSAKPMLNRAVSGIYSPGSTFKPLSAIAGLQTGNLKINELIEDKGVYKYYNDYQPSCWIWSEYHTTHGKLNVSGAIENSCNYFFYEVGRRLGIDALVEYAGKFGLGRKTGIELPEEAEGHMASPAYKKQAVLTVTNGDWFGGDTLQAAIGQSYSLFTPVQLANYTAAIANGGMLYKVNLLKSAHLTADGTTVYEANPTVVEDTGIKPEYIAAVKDGMKKVVDEGGTASDIFQGYGIQIGGKTGTAQLGDGSNNAVFIAFAPFDNPEIAVSIVLEHGVSGKNAAYVARDIFDEYFKLNAKPQETEAVTDKLP